MTWPSIHRSILLSICDRQDVCHTCVMLHLQVFFPLHSWACLQLAAARREGCNKAGWYNRFIGVLSCYLALTEDKIQRNSTPPPFAAWPRRGPPKQCASSRRHQSAAPPPEEPWPLQGGFCEIKKCEHIGFNLEACRNLAFLMNKDITFEPGRSDGSIT